MNLNWYKSIALLSSCLMICLCTVAHASVRIFDLNTQSWLTMRNECRQQPIPTSHECIGAITQRINQEDNIDFITTQENDHGSLTNGFGLDPKYVLAGNEEDSMIFYDSSRWSLMDFKTIDLIPDALLNGGKGVRRLVMAYVVNNVTSQAMVIASTHLCVNWSNSAGCDYQNQMIPSTFPYQMKGDIPSAKAHQYDAYTIVKALANFHQGAPTIVTGDFNTQFPLGSIPGTDADVLPEVFNAGNYQLSFKKLPWDFIFHNDKLTVVKTSSIAAKTQGNPSDHPSLDVTFDIISRN